MPITPFNIGGLSEKDVREMLAELQHNNLNGIQGGNAAERFHLTQAQVTKLNNAAASSDVIKVHNNLQNIQGGSQNERYHLTAAQLSKVDNSASQGDLANKTHNSLQGLQGGNANERYHLTNAQVTKLDNAPAGTNHNTNLTGLQGGSATERYHLTLAELQKLQSGGTTGATGPQGPAGANGKSAYELAVQNGFSGTLTQWLNSLKGETGPAGTTVHNSTTGLQGGASGQYYHLTQAQYNALTAASGILGLSPESWTFTLEDGSTVTKKVTLWP